MRDLLRQRLVAVSAVVAIVGAFVGSGAFGGLLLIDVAGGALRPDATLIAPAGPAFAIWTPIYIGLVAYAVWQATPAQRDSERHRALGYPIAASMLLNAGWLVVAQLEALALSVPIAVLIMTSLLVAISRAARTSPSGRLDDVVTDGTIGLYLGWSVLTVFANTTAVLVAGGFRGLGVDANAWAIAIFAMLAVLGVALAAWTGGRLAPSLAITWGLAWIVQARMLGERSSMSAGIAAAMAALAIITFTILVRAAENHRPDYSADVAGAKVSQAPAPASNPVMNQR